MESSREGGVSGACLRVEARSELGLPGDRSWCFPVFSRTQGMFQEQERGMAFISHSFIVDCPTNPFNRALSPRCYAWVGETESVWNDLC